MIDRLKGTPHPGKLNPADVRICINPIVNVKSGTMHFLGGSVMRWVQSAWWRTSKKESNYLESNGVGQHTPRALKPPPISLVPGRPEELFISLVIIRKPFLQDSKGRQVRRSQKALSTHRNSGPNGLLDGIQHDILTRQSKVILRGRLGIHVRASFVGFCWKIYG